MYFSIISPCHIADAKSAAISRALRSIESIVDLYFFSDEVKYIIIITKRKNKSTPQK
jgi:hypothetical protein